MRGATVTAIALALAIPYYASAQTLPAGVTERAITVPGPVPLPGTLTLPAGAGPFALVVLVHGSGPEDQDQTIGPNKMFRDVAWGLAVQGVAVLRYDKRTKVNGMWFLGKPFTVKDETMDDALSALALARQQPEINRARTFLLGHSEGGILAPRIAQQDPLLAGIIIAAGATRMRFGDQMERQYAYIQSVSGADSEATRKAIAPVLPLIARIRALTPVDSANTTLIMGAPAKYFLDLDEYDAAATMREFPKPSLVLQGSRDYQITLEQLDDWLKAVGPRADMTVKRYPGLWHLFMPGSGTPADYGVPGHVEAQVITDIAGWIKAH